MKFPTAEVNAALTEFMKHGDQTGETMTQLLRKRGLIQYSKKSWSLTPPGRAYWNSLEQERAPKPPPIPMTEEDVMREMLDIEFQRSQRQILSCVEGLRQTLNQIERDVARREKVFNPFNSATIGNLAVAIGQHDHIVEVLESFPKLKKGE